MKSAEGGCGQKIVYGSHAQEKFEILKRHGFVVSKRQVRETLQRPEKIEEGFRGRKVAQRRISEKHVLRVVYEEGQREIRVVTFYPGRRSRYESSI
jgi:Txe/YoeB family toxin of Txe-Axe toxin-antitoxin module